MITQVELKEYVNYDALTGIFTNIKSRQGCRFGGILGSAQTDGYLQTYINGKAYLLHRLAWLYVHGSFPLSILDHKDLDKKNNKIANLRPANHSKNQFNRGVAMCSKSGSKGVTKNGSAWRAQACIDGSRHHLGNFKTIEEAAKAYQSFAKAHHGEFYKRPVARQVSEK